LFAKKHMRILLIEDDSADAKLIQEMLKDASLPAPDLVHASRLSDGLQRISEERFDALLIDLGLPDSKGIDTLKTVLAQSPETPIIVLTGLADEVTGIQAVQVGAQDYLVKGSVNGDLLMRSTRYAIERKRLMTELRNLSLLDDLTGLNNRRGFFALAEQQMKLAAREKRGLLVMLGDLDDMKKINDTLGHEKGDLALRDTATILKETFRGSDVIARIGGDEFAVCIVEDEKSGEDVVTKRLQKSLDEYNNRETRPFRLSLSLGFAHCGYGSPCSIGEMLSKADKLMYGQKRSKHKKAF
jgi:two-component system cell cycle response regulator